MIELPDQNYQRREGSRANEHMVVADWAELNALFDAGNDEVHQSEIVDVLKESNWPLAEAAGQSRSDRATEIAVEALEELARRAALEGPNAAYAVDPANLKLSRTEDWQDRLPQAFMALCSSRFYYSQLADLAPFNDHNLRGRLFEQLVGLTIQRPNWRLQHAGWSQNNAITIEALRDAMASHLEEQPLDITEYVGKSHKDLGLDYYSWRPFSDNWPAKPVLLVQCASGVDWRTKLGTPDTGIWTQVLRFTGPPLSAITIPFVLRRTAFKTNGSLQKGLVFDRIRLLSAGVVTPQDPLRTELEQFCAAGIGHLPQST